MSPRKKKIMDEGDRMSHRKVRMMTGVRRRKRDMKEKGKEKKEFLWTS